MVIGNVTIKALAIITNRAWSFGKWWNTLAAIVTRQFFCRNLYEHHNDNNYTGNELTLFWDVACWQMCLTAMSKCNYSVGYYGDNVIVKDIRGGSRISEEGLNIMVNPWHWGYSQPPKALGHSHIIIKLYQMQEYLEQFSKVANTRVQSSYSVYLKLWYCGWNTLGIS